MNLTHLIKIWLLMAIVALSANGAVKANIASGPQNFGLKVHQGKSIAKPLMRQGKSQVSTMAASDIFIEEDKETGLLYAKARYYDPDTAKFLSEDAWEGDNMIAPSLHRYLYAYQNPTVWIDPTGNCPSGQIGYVGEVSAGCRGPRTWGERYPITASIVGPMSSVAFRRNGNLYDPVNKQELTGKQAFDAKFNTLFTALPASKAKALSSAASRFVGAQATKVKDAAAPFVNKANEVVGPAVRATKEQIGKVTKPIANAIPSKLKPSSWSFNPSARFDEAVAEQARQRARSNAGGANLITESNTGVAPNIADDFVYHGTDNLSARSIANDGLNIDKNQLADSVPDKNGFSVTTNKQDAIDFAYGKSAIRNAEQGRTDLTPVVVKAKKSDLPNLRSKNQAREGEVFDNADELKIQRNDFEKVGPNTFKVDEDL
jgi:RHS repeat-associated protein